MVCTLQTWRHQVWLLLFSAGHVFSSINLSRVDHSGGSSPYSQLPGDASSSSPFWPQFLLFHLTQLSIDRWLWVALCIEPLYDQANFVTNATKVSFAN
jgi:hypothetical protein